MVEWDSIDTVLLDMDGTLLDLHFDNYFWQHYLPQHYARKHAVSEEHARQTLYRHFEIKRGTLDWYCLDYWSEQLALDIPTLKLDLRHLIQLRPNALRFLVFLREQGKRVVLVTNAHPASLSLKMQVTNIENHFDRLVSAHQLGYPKEDQAFWEKLRELENLEPARTLFIDDTHSILEAARAFGIGHVLGIVFPDSKGEARTSEIFRLVEDLGHLSRH